MKKIIGVILMVMVTMISVLAFADKMEDLDNYLRENNLNEVYNGRFENGVYYFSGIMDTEHAEKELNIHKNWDEVSIWFENWYENALMEHFPEYGRVHVAMEKAGQYNETVIYHITVKSENDLVDFIDEKQDIVEMLVVFY